MVFPCPNIHLW